jgi:hypothetical protein
VTIEKRFERTAVDSWTSAALLVFWGVPSDSFDDWSKKDEFRL